MAARGPGWPFRTRRGWSRGRSRRSSALRPTRALRGCGPRSRRSGRTAALSAATTSRGRIYARRAVALAVLVLAVGGIAWGVRSAVHKDAPPPPPPPPPPASAASRKVLHIVFPEGFTRRDMAERIT